MFTLQLLMQLRNAFDKMQIIFFYICCQSPGKVATSRFPEVEILRLHTCKTPLSFITQVKKVSAPPFYAYQ